MNLNNQQQLAVDTIDKNVCVVAGAGTGKTAILTHRFINIIKNSNLEPHLALQSILAITFTKTASNEMVERIRKELSNLEISDKNYDGILNYLPFVNISTIDSFCKSIVDENSLKIGLDREYEIISDLESSLLLDEVILNILKSEENSKILMELMLENKYFRLKDISRDIKKVFIKIQQKGYDFDDLYNLNPLLNIEIEDFHIFISKIENYYNHIVEEKIVNGNNKIVKDFKKGYFDDLKNSSSENRLDLLLNLKAGLERVKNPDFEKNKEFIELTNQQILNAEKDRIKYYEYLNNLLKKIEKNYRELKLKNASLEYYDLLYYTREILKDKEILNHYQNKFKYIMIDEFQDTNKLQVDIFYMLSSKENLLDRDNFFVVGDPKQSIYGFRGSDLNVFEKSLIDIENSGGVIINLVENYRSSEELIKYSNILFTELMKDKYMSLNYNYEGTSKPVDFYDIIEINFNEAEVVARIVLNFMKDGKDLNDIAILFRSSTHLEELEKALTRYNIPYINPKSKAFYNKREILDIILFLKFINEPRDSESLYGLLRSNFFLIEDKQLYNIEKTTNSSFYDSLNKYDGDDEYLLNCINLLNKCLSMKNKSNIYDILQIFIKETNYYEIINSISNTLQPLENIRQFENLLLEYEEKNGDFLNEFLEYLSTLSKEDAKEALVDVQSGVLNLMTIHSSKGLEFKSVIFYDSKNTPQSTKDSIIAGVKTGYAIKLGSGSLLHEITLEELKEEERLERERLLYVCVTRAKEDFVIISVRDNDKPPKKDSSFLSTLRDLEGYEYNIYDSLKEVKESPKIIRKYSTNESKVVSHSDFKVSSIEKPTSSISGYNVFKRCKLEYYYKYKLGLKDVEFKNERFDDIYIENQDETSLNFDPKEYGILVHEFIENYTKNDNLDEKINKTLSKHNINDKFIIQRFKKHINNYLNLKLPGNKYFEYKFLLNLDEGYINGSIDELVINNDGIYIVDFKTNFIKDINKLTDLYTPQMILYSIAVKNIFNIVPKEVLIHFLDNNQVVKIPWNETENKKIIEELNSFLRFINYNDSIDKYAGADSCNEYCNYKLICDRKINGQ